MSQITERDLLAGLSPERKKKVIALANRMAAQRTQACKQEIKKKPTPN